MDRHSELGTAPIGKLLFRYSVPAIISMIVNALYNFVDRIFIGNIEGIGALAITGVGISIPILLILVAFAVGIAIGAATNISLKLGQGKRDEAEAIMGNAAMLSVAIGVILTIIYFCARDSILGFFGATSASLQYAGEYTDMLMVGATHWMLMFTLSAIIRADGNPRKSAMVLIVGCLINVPLDWIFIFELDMGIRGAALATVIAEFVGVVICILHFAQRRSNLVFRMAALKPKWELIKVICAIGVTPFTTNLSMSAAALVYNHSLKEYGGDLAIGALTTISSILMVFVMIIFGLMQGMQPIVGYNYGAKNFDRAKRAFLMTVSGAVAVMSVGLVIMQLFPEFCVSLFNKDPELMALTVDGIHRYAVTMPIAAIMMVGSNYIMAIGRAKLSLSLSLLRQIGIQIPILLILPQFLGLSGVWIANPVSDIVVATVVVVALTFEFRGYKKA
ncbi:MAG: MATE family efflux transporter [Deferribacteraceae bacterium]|nr:MATE family efflux transporter [Deferribacteraceae bacterium]